MIERHVIRNDQDVSIAVVIAQTYARECNFNEDKTQRLGTAVAELARNICKYSHEKGGDMLIQLTKQSHGRSQLKLQFRDNGPGISDITQALQDHFSTSGTLGLGLSGVKRMVDHFEIQSLPGDGTVVTIMMDQD